MLVHELIRQREVNRFLHDLMPQKVVERCLHDLMPHKEIIGSYTSKFVRE
jgi:hypothetical protein